MNNLSSETKTVAAMRDMVLPGLTSCGLRLQSGEKLVEAKL
jgi:hypothetical protein